MFLRTFIPVFVIALFIGSILSRDHYFARKMRNLQTINSELSPTSELIEEKKTNIPENNFFNNQLKGNADESTTMSHSDHLQNKNISYQKAYNFNQYGLTENRFVLGPIGRILQSFGEKAYKIWFSLFRENVPPIEYGISFYLFTRRNPTVPETLVVKEDFLANKKKVLMSKTSSYILKNSVRINRNASCYPGKARIFIPLSHIYGKNQSICFNIMSPTKIIIHGYTQTCIDERIISLKDAYLVKDDYNVIIVDWTNLAVGPNYWTAVKNSKFVGNHLGKLLQQLSITGAMLSTFHIIGFSLGAQVAGFIKLSLSHANISRITGLDPALPLFQHTESGSSLNSSAAKFVDVIHTSGGFLGQSSALGHADFYPNGGCKQPGCDKSSIICSHNRALSYFTESVNSKLGFCAVLCPSWEAFEANLCNVSAQPISVLMGDPCTLSAKGTYYLRTAGKEPFAITWWEP